MPVELGLGVEFLLLQHAGLLLHAHIAVHALVLLLEMLLQERDILEGFVIAAGLAIDPDPALELLESLELFLGQLAAVEHIAEVGVGQHLALVLAEADRLLGDHDLLGLMLDRARGTLQMGQLLFLLMARIL